jgi:hypothetical protein
MYMNRSKKYIVFPNSSPVLCILLCYFCTRCLSNIRISSAFTGRKRKHQEILLFTLVKEEHLSLLDVVAQFPIFAFQYKEYILLHSEYIRNICGLKRLGHETEFKYFDKNL